MRLTAGTIQAGVWCGACQSPSAIRVPLHHRDHGGPLAATVEICPACGAHAIPSTPVVTVRPGDRIKVTGPAWWWHRWWCRRRGLVVTGCAYEGCRRPGRYRHAWIETRSDGTIRWVFCHQAHRRAWLYQRLTGRTAQ